MTLDVLEFGLSWDEMVAGLWLRLEHVLGESDRGLRCFRRWRPGLHTYEVGAMENYRTLRESLV